MDDHDRTAFLATPRFAGLCTQDDEGRLVTSPVWIEGASDQALELTLLIDTPIGGAACVVADEFNSYVGIRGAIVRGLLEEAPPDPSHRRLAISRARGFSFEDTTTSL